MRTRCPPRSRRCRHTLPGCGGLIGVDSIVTTANGYRLVVPAQSIDAVVFADLVRRARVALDAGDPAETARLLGEAFGGGGVSRTRSSVTT